MRRASVAVTVALGILLVIGAVVVFGFFTFRYLSVCPECGMLRDTTEWQLPRCDVTYMRRHRLRHSPLSEALHESAAVGEHEHDWLFVWGAGNGVRRVIGIGDLAEENARDPMVVSFARDLVEYADAEEVRKWGRLILDENKASHLRFFLEDDYPEGGFDNEKEFKRWWDERIPEIEEYLERPGLFSE